MQILNPRLLTKLIIIYVQLKSIFCWFAGACQCFSNADCTGDQIPATDQRACCVDTNNGLSYNSGGTCTVCIGMLDPFH